MEILLLLLCLVVRNSALSVSDCGAQARRPLPTDISVKCGTSYICVSIQICPVIFSGYNESLLIMNNVLDPACRATLNVNATPPVASFTFPVNLTSACGSVFTTTSTAGTGVFSDFSNIQTVNISGIVRSFDPTTGTITYNTELKYYYSCAYPLEYLINNTEIDVTSSAIAIKDNNGSFISTLTMKLFNDVNYTQPMIIPSLGIELKTTVYVEVKAINLTGQYNVLLDRCYATISPLPSNSSFFNLFVPCTTGQLTNIILNGDSQSARFSFPAFRFTEQQNQTVSTYYLHCITRLCEISTCSSFKQCSSSGRKKRDTAKPKDGATDSYTITSQRIVTKADSTTTTENPIAAQQKSSSSGGLGAAVGILAFACLTAFTVAAVFYKRLRK
ncbi:zona pellucida-like domain-containing protein 1 [Anabas testudineus]|uniref:ZP domain-containing protein n=1 Tax=Anabas testudineus TaxID=64144 RepID=A0A3Q1H8M2_ANATE|nr:zona pellucida-like domain-containing protein 1 [Anabas testudineus]